ncbi:hypothetical protein P8H26_07115 [Pseudochrobactrum sp. sp1633]|uniref:hypothetical protein n=1 Tax=Pseudochrobactrum sp. sp1633 TaxID=3036706 RepID=UPI0025A59493|nr:hypothetical protein [Pseudochrobactrum sp. sp1633]MDM8345160.1 hypothetical protein [Pseudochrobactrum sp. sp1633]HWD12989.1 hypothetical protein [Pseudochrobactrum sp.]
MKSSSGSVLRKFVFILPLFTLAACSTLNSSKVSGTSSGSALTGSSVSNAVLAPMGNGILGAAITQLAPADRRAAVEAEYKALEYAPKGEAVTWKGRSGKASGEVTAAQPYQVGSQNCRQYNHSFTVDGAPQLVRGTACRNDDGSWTPLT